MERDKASGGNKRKLAGLHPKGKPVNFYCSHRCTSSVRLGQGRVRCANTSAPRYFRFLRLLRFLLLPLPQNELFL